MPDPKDYLDDDVTYVKGYVRRKRGTIAPEQSPKENKAVGIVVWLITLAIEITFIMVLNPNWLLENLLLVIIIIILIPVAAIVGMTIYRKNR